MIHSLEMDAFDWVIIALIVICFIVGVVCCCCFRNQLSSLFRCGCGMRSGMSPSTIIIQQPSQGMSNKPSQQPQKDKKEGFLSSGSEGAFQDGDSVVGPRMYATQIIDNGKTWDDVLNTAKKDKIASDGIGTLGAGRGEGFDKELKNQQSYNAYLTKQGKLSSEEVNKITRAINNGIANSLGEISMFNRGKQVTGNLIIQDGLNSTIAMMDEKYYSEREKNRNIYTTTKVIHAKGFDVNPENLGREFSDYKPAKMLSRNKKRIPYVEGAARPKTGVDVNNGKITLETDKATVSTDVQNGKTSDGSVQKQLDNGKTMVGVKNTK